jgi:hypothetical protein
MISSAAYAQDQGNSDMQQMLNRIDELEKQLKRMEEENKARKSLEVTEEEKAQQEKEVLEAVSRDYTLDPARTLGIDYSLGYSYSKSEQLLTVNEVLELKRTSEHTLTHNISGTYSILDNLAVSGNIPIVYRYDKVGTTSQLDQTDIGDISFGTAWQPIKSGPGDIHSTASFGVTLPTGRSPYKINPDKELSTGNGTYTFNVGGNFSKQVDPVVVFWSLGYGHSLELSGLDYTVVQDTYILKKVVPGDSFNFSAGFGYAMSYATSINMSFNYKYTKNTKLTYKVVSTGGALNVNTGDDIDATAAVGMGWRVSPKTTLSFSFGYSLTEPSFSLSFRVPFTFVL